MLLALGITCLGYRSAQAKPKLKKKPAATQQKHKAKTKAATRHFVTRKQKTVAPAQLDPATEFEVIDEDAARLNNALAVTPDDMPARQALTELALRAARAAEKALSRGDEKMFAAYSSQFRRRFDETLPGLATMAERGIGAADYALGAIALHGWSTPKNLDEACARFAAAVSKGFGGGRFRHAQCIEESDPERSLTLIREAADAGHVAANERMGRICLDAEPPNVSCALIYLERAARDGRPTATTLLGWMHAEGITGTPDLVQGAKLYAEAARRGENAARNNLGELYEKGRGVAKSETIAFKYYLAAALEGFPPGQFNVGRLYAAGHGTARDPVEARRWLEQADKAGIPQAQEILRLLDQDSK